MFYGLITIILISLISALVGVTAISRLFSKENLFLLLSLAVGTMIGDAFIHLIPEHIEIADDPTLTGILILMGILIFFVIEKVIHWRHCHDNSEEHITHHPFAIENLVGDGIHNFIDGMLIAGAFATSPTVGLATAFAVALHEIPQEVGDFAILIHSGFSRSKALVVNLLTALMAVVGYGVVWLIGDQMQIVAALLPVTAGGFIYIAISDLIPEMRHDQTPMKSALQLLFIIIGISAMLLLTLLEIS